MSCPTGFACLGFIFLLMLINHSSSSYFFWTVLFTPVHSVDAKSYPGQSGWIHELWRSGYELPHIAHCKEAANQGMNVHQLVWHNFQCQYFPCWTLTLHRPYKSHALSVRLTHSSVMSRSHAAVCESHAFDCRAVNSISSSADRAPICSSLSITSWRWR